MKNLTGQRFGRLIAVRRGANRGAMTTWVCECDCGNDHVVPTQYLRSGRTKSCGCYRMEMSWIKRPEQEKRTPQNTYQYNAWYNIMGKTTDPDDPKWPVFGGQGIRIHEPWLDFACFVQDVGIRPSMEHVLDRVDNQGDYTPDNYRWVLRASKANNRRNNVKITWRGVSLTVTQWAEGLGVSQELIRSRRRSGWTEERMLTHRIDPKRIEELLEEHRSE